MSSALALFGTAGVVMGFFKMKGPLRKMVQSQHEERLMQFFNKGLAKYDNRPVDTVMRDLVRSEVTLAREMTEGFIKPIYNEPAALLSSPSTLISSIKSKENQLLTGFSAVVSGNTGTLDIGGSADSLGRRMAHMDNADIHGKKVRVGPQSVDPLTLTTDMKMELHNDLLARIRQQTIIEYLQSGPGFGKSGFAEAYQDLQKYQGEEYFKGELLQNTELREAVKRTTTLHESLLNEPEYAARYNKNLIPLARRARLNPNSLPQKLVREGYKSFRSFAYGDLVPLGTEIDNLTVAPEWQALYSRANPTDFGKLEQLTSAGKKAWKTNVQILNKIGNVQYGPALKRMVKVLSNAMTEDCGLEDFNLRLASYNYLQGERRYIVLQLKHQKRRNPMEIHIPIETNGYVPSSSPSALRKIGRFYEVESVFGAAKEGTLIRNTQYLIHELSNYFESSAMKSGIGSFKDRPESFESQVRHSITKTNQLLANETGADRDFVQMTSVLDPNLPDLVNPGPNVSAKLRAGYQNFALNMRHMQTIARSDKKSVVITIDLESLSNSPKGPEFQVTDPATQFVKGAVAVADMSDRTILAGTELSSTHGYKYFQKQGFGTQLRDWIKTSVIPNGGMIDDKDVVQAYANYLRQSGAKDFANNKEFFMALKNTIENFRKEFEGKGYSVYYVTKNGSQFDLRAFQYNLEGDWWVSNVLEKRHIDIQATASVMKRGYFQEGSLSAERILAKMMADLGDGELAGQITRGHLLNPAQKKDMVKKILTNFSKKGSAGVGSNARLLNLSNTLFTHFEKQGWLESLHASPLLDALGTFGMFVSQYEHMKGNQDWNNATGLIEKYLRSGSAVDTAYNIVGVLQSMTKKVYPGFGVLSTTALTHGMTHNMLASFLTLGDLLNLPDVPLNKQMTQRAGQDWFVRPSTKWLTQHPNVKTTDIAYIREFGRAFATDTINEIHNLTLPTATDAANAYSKTAMMKGVYTLDFTKGGDDAGRFLIRDTALSKFNLTKLQTFDLDEVVQSDVLLTERLHNVRKETVRILETWVKEGKIKDINEATGEMWELAGRQAAGNTTVTLSEEILGASKFNQIKVDKKGVAGKVLAVIKEKDVNGVARWKVKMELSMSAIDAGHLAAQAALTGEKSTIQVVKALSDGFAHGIPNGYDFAAHFKALSKEYIGPTKEVFLNHTLYSLFDEYHRTKSSVQKTTIKEAIDKLAGKLGAVADLDSYRMEFKRMDLGPIDDFTRYLGNTDLQLMDITEAAKKGGLVWTAKEVQEIENSASRRNTFKYLRRALEDHIKDLKREASNNNGCLTGLDQISTEKAFRNMDEFAKILLPKTGEAKLVVLNSPTRKGMPARWQVDVPTYDNNILYGLTNVDGNIRSNQRIEYMLPQKFDKSLVGDSAVSWLTDYAVHKSSQVHRDALATFQRYRDTLAGTLIKSGHTSLDQIDFLLNRESGLKAAAEVMKSKSYTGKGPVDLAELQSKIIRLADLAGENKQLSEQQNFMLAAENVSDLLTKKGSKEFTGRFTRSPKFRSYSDVMTMHNLAMENNGVLALLLPDSAVNNVRKIDLRKEAQRFVGMIVGDKTMNQSDINGVVETIITSLDKVKQNSGKKAPFKIENGVLEMGSLLIPFDKNVENNYNLLGPNIWLENNDTNIKMGIMQAYKNLQSAIAMKDPVEEANNIKYIHREYVRMLLLSFGADKNSKLWESIQYNPPGIMPKHKGIESVKLSAMEMLENINRSGRFNRLKGGPTLSRIKTALGNITSADIDTILITEKSFNQIRNPARFTTSKGVQFDGNAVHFASLLEKNLGTTGKEIRQGQRYLPGGIMVRYPQTQSGGANLLASKYLVVPKEISEYIGMDDNSFYAHTFLFSFLQGADNDGDQAVLHFREINSITDYFNRMEENRSTLKSISNNLEIRNLIKSNQITRDANGNIVKVNINEVNNVVKFTPSGKALISAVEYDKNNNLVTNFFTVDESKLEMEGFAQSIAKTCQGIARHTKGFFDAADYMKQEIMRSQMPAFSKQLIPAATNLLKKRMFQLAYGSDAKRIPGGTSTTSNMIGTISHGLVAQLGQIPIEIGKHVDPNRLSEVTKWFDYWRDPMKFEKFKDVAFEGYYEQYASLGKDIPDKMIVREEFDYLSNLFRNIDTIENLSPEAKIYQKSALNGLMGRDASTFWDLMNIQYLDPRITTVSEQRKGLQDMLGGLKYRVNISDDAAAMFRKGGKVAAISAAVLLGLSFFKPFSPSNSISPLDSFISLGDVNSQHNLIASPLELPRGVPLDVVNPSFPNGISIKLNENPNVRRAQSAIATTLLRTTRLGQPFDFYNVPVQPKISYTNYTTSVPTMGTSDFQRRSSL